MLGIETTMWSLGTSKRCWRLRVRSGCESMNEYVAIDVHASRRFFRRRNTATQASVRRTSARMRTQRACRTIHGVVRTGKIDPCLGQDPSRRSACDSTPSRSLSRGMDHVAIHIDLSLAGWVVSSHSTPPTMASLGSTPSNARTTFLQERNARERETGRWKAAFLSCVAFGRVQESFHIVSSASNRMLVDLDSKLRRPVRDETSVPSIPNSPEKELRVRRNSHGDVDGFFPCPVSGSKGNPFPFRESTDVPVSKGNGNRNPILS